MGVSGSGKSAIAEGLIPDGVVVRSDLVRKEMAGGSHTNMYTWATKRRSTPTT